MKFMIMHKVTPETESGAPPTPELIAGVGRLIEEGLAEKVFVSGEGLKPTKERLHLSYAGGKRTLTRGPFSDVAELPQGFALLRVRSEEEVLALCDKFAEVVGDVELFLGPVVEPWDLGMMPKPPGAPLRYLSMHRHPGDEESEAPPDPEHMHKMGALIDELTKSGTLQETAALMNTRRGARITFRGTKHKITDGPFTESKELVSGYSILQLPSKAAAIEWAIRFAKVVPVEEIDVRQVAEY